MRRRIAISLSVNQPVASVSLTAYAVNGLSTSALTNPEFPAASAVLHLDPCDALSRDRPDLLPGLPTRRFLR